MLSGEITTMCCQDALDILTDDLENTFIELFRRNIRLMKDNRGLFTPSAEQKQLLEYIVEYPDKLISLLMPTTGRPLIDTLREYAKEAGLELRG